MDELQPPPEPTPERWEDVDELLDALPTSLRNRALRYWRTEDEDAEQPPVPEAPTWEQALRDWERERIEAAHTAALLFEQMKEGPQQQPYRGDPDHYLGPLPERYRRHRA